MTNQKLDITITNVEPVDGTWKIGFKAKDPLNQIQLMQGHIPNMSNADFFAATEENDLKEFVRGKLIERLNPTV